MHRSYTAFAIFDGNRFACTSTVRMLVFRADLLVPELAADNATEAPPNPIKLIDAFEAAHGKFEGYRW